MSWDWHEETKKAWDGKPVDDATFRRVVEYVKDVFEKMNEWGEVASWWQCHPEPKRTVREDIKIEKWSVWHTYLPGTNLVTVRVPRSWRHDRHCNVGAGFQLVMHLGYKQDDGGYNICKAELDIERIP